MRTVAGKPEPKLHGEEKNPAPSSVVAVLWERLSYTLFVPGPLCQHLLIREACSLLWGLDILTALAGPVYLSWLSLQPVCIYGIFSLVGFGLTMGSWQWRFGMAGEEQA